MEVIVARQVYTVEKRVDKASERPYTRVNNSTSALVSQPHPRSDVAVRQQLGSTLRERQKIHPPLKVKGLYYNRSNKIFVEKNVDAKSYLMSKRGNREFRPT